MFKFFAGCDTHKAEHSITIIDQEGQIQESFPIKNNLSGWMQALNVFQKYESLLCGIENHANYAKLFAKFLLNNNIEAKEVNPVFTGKTRKAHTRKGKTDEIDSLVVAKITRDEQNYLPDIVINEKQDELKAITRQRENIVTERARVINRLHSKLTQIDTCYKTRYGKNLVNPYAILMIEEDFAKYRDIRSILILKDIKKLRCLTDEINEIEEIMKEYVKDNELIQNLCTIKGIGMVTACKLVALVGDISKFKNADKLASYVGAAPIKFASGSFSKDIKNKGGQKELHTLIKQIAKTQKRYDPEAKRYFEKKLSEQKTEKQAKICLQRKIVKIIYMIYKYNKPYNYQKQLPMEVLQAA